MIEIIFCLFKLFSKYCPDIKKMFFCFFPFNLSARDVKSNMISMCYDLKSETIFSDFLLWKKVQVNCLDYGLTLKTFFLQLLSSWVSNDTKFSINFYFK